MNKIQFAKVKPNAIIPYKNDEDAGYDIYPCFDEEYMKIYPFQTKLIPTGIASAFDEGYVFVIRERGSTGIKGMKVSAGVIDSSFRGEWFIAIYNGGDRTIVITKEKDIEKYNKDYNIHDYNKAIAQALLLPVPKTTIEETSYDELLKIPSKRGMGQLGSSDK